jgi:hypothetical protein
MVLVQKQGCRRRMSRIRSWSLVRLQRVKNVKKQFTRGGSTAHRSGGAGDSIEEGGIRLQSAAESWRFILCTMQGARLAGNASGGAGSERMNRPCPCPSFAEPHDRWLKSEPGLSLASDW